MVNWTSATILALSLIVSGDVSGDSVVHSVRLASAPTVHIKPFEPVFVVLEVTVDASVDKRNIDRVGKDLSAKVIVNGREHVHEFRSTVFNPVAGFIPDARSLAEESENTKFCGVLAILHWNGDDNGFLFSEPGAYAIELAPSVRINVIVDPPTDLERQAITHIGKLGIEFSAYLMAPGYSRSEKVILTVEKIVALGPETAYHDWLTICLGMSKLRVSDNKSNQKRGDFMRSRAEVIHTYLEPYADRPVTSPFIAMAASEVASNMLMQLKSNTSVTENEAAVIRQKARSLLEKVRDSPFSMERGIAAERQLKKLPQ